jgi:CHASE3 domain sensor protein
MVSDKAQYLKALRAATDDLEWVVNNREDLLEDRIETLESAVRELAVVCDPWLPPQANDKFAAIVERVLPEGKI